jgi:hypothetical protein
MIFTVTSGRKHLEVNVIFLTCEKTTLGQGCYQGYYSPHTTVIVVIFHFITTRIHKHKLDVIVRMLLQWHYTLTTLKKL